MNNLIITTKRSPLRKLFDYLATLVLWILFAFFIVHFLDALLSGVFWESEARNRLQFYFMLAVANAIVLILWAFYNMLRFQKQHKTALHYNSRQFARSLGISEELYQQIQNSRKMRVHFNNHGQIKMVITEKLLGRM
ncbi:poly-beta-1,6-N-acetyl-D-glucosamine biosynthesis protein PgaD [Escherichia fergusonii]|uniref:poly-beta-1,6-N-acetyl-D-glucosamine biosynthesis protein PgaD n=1 Tax=Escherichia fergusonii TaxID=564 RepID=UPI00178F72FE|nr:poly-beta-1,6-N-acetyl-D-glucosamine biosynthesis protein PgaD [Escherichia fergusonii]EFL4478217.1 poly-beta-1,6-N-acetyl-D-glucosamine biosynthesis protein PgaD [Escherichia fergusonii]MBY7445785.1 poly-beta-1,6-N-acetyl-D-glucosamine biosynthesis protein PgaD [Escherichia fergusonii]MBY7558762.1 poly-beta-1,6-N-acetyl-D-glucosamine biosynthesis protein PgaD [Escherichia fergusonii]MCH5363558.1 poly-beta-1,6-N-acetyl-D-glucosamine biosynthesis protein PgaD [Escherichia fergusonii]HCO50152